MILTLLALLGCAPALAQDPTLDLGIIYTEVRLDDGTEQALRLDVYRTLSETGATRPVAIVVPPAPGQRLNPFISQIGRGLAGSGIITIAIDYRASDPNVGYPESLADLVAAIDWLDLNATTLGLDPHRLVLVGIEGSGDILARLSYQSDARELDGRIAAVAALFPETSSLSDTDPVRTPPLFLVGDDPAAAALRGYADAHGLQTEHYPAPATRAARAAAMQQQVAPDQTLYARLLAFAGETTDPR